MDSAVSAADARTSPTADRALVLGCPIDRLDMAGTVERCRQIIEKGDFGQHMAINAAKLVAMHEDPKLREVVVACDVINADGQAVVWASRAVGDRLPSRVAGIDLMGELLGLAESNGYRVYILGAHDYVLRDAVRRLLDLHPRLQLAGYRHGYFHDSESERVCQQIRASGADILFVAMTSPRKEYFLGKYGEASGVRLAMGVGGAIDVVAGVTRRAPMVMQRTGLEWLFRLLQEPKRLARRYLTTNVRFAGLLLRDVYHRRLTSRTS